MRRQVLQAARQMFLATALGGPFADMIERGDQTVYRSKASGRNRVVDLSPDHVASPD
jgi:hypothetical protein